MWKDWIRPYLRPLGQWSAIAMTPPQQSVTASLRWDGQSADVTIDHTVASLNPLVIATSIDAGRHAELEYRDKASGRLLGTLRLARLVSTEAVATPLTLYQVTGGKHHCLSWPQRSWNMWLQNRAMSKNRSSHGFGMNPIAVQQLMIAYLCPRPVVLVSVGASDHRNIFPMDLIGPLERSGLFSLALRTTNISVPSMRAVRQVALSSVPATMKPIAYKLSEHHKCPPSDWAALPFSVRPSRKFGIPAVAGALHIRELVIEHSHEIGLHTFFVCRIASDEKLVEGVQLHHTAGFHQAFRRRQGTPFAET